MNFEDEDNDSSMFTNKNEGDNKDMISVNIKTVQGDSDQYDVNLTDKVSTLIEKYSKDRGYQKNAKVIFNFKGKNLEENKTIQECGIDSDDTIHVLIRLKGGN